MLFSTIAIAALAGQVVVAEGVRKPYKPELARMSVKSILLGRRQDDGGYQPDTTLCGTGTTCAEACGAGFEQCGSITTEVHCYDAANAQTCCPNNSGDSCDAGYFCSADTTGSTYCCPNGSSLEDCAAVFSVAGGLSSQVPVATSTSSAVESSTYPSSPETTTTSSSSTVISTTSYEATTTSSATADSSTTTECTTYTSEIVQTIIPIPVTTGYNATTISKSTSALPTTSKPASTTIPVQAGASSIHVSAIVVVAAAAFAALL